MCTCFPPSSFFPHRIDAIISEFIWNKKKSQAKQAIPAETKNQQVVWLYQILGFTQTANIRIIQAWLQFDSYHPPPSWLKMEATSCGPVSLSALAHSPVRSASSNYTKNIIVKATLKIWNQFKTNFGLQTYSVPAPITANHVFPPSLIDGAFNT